MEKPIKTCQQLYKALIEKNKVHNKRSVDVLGESTGKIIEIIRAQHNTR